LLRVLPKLRFQIKHMAVSGAPWATTVVVEWRDYATLADGTAYVNDGAHAIQLRWGKVTHLHAYLDTDVMIDAMQKMSAAGVAEATAPQIED
jgi:ketosteroid isomerase-like protein